MLRLQFRKQPQDFVKLTSSISIGRDESNDLVIEAPTVSDFHAEIVVEGADLAVVDLLSASGTFVNGKRIDQRTQLQCWDVVRLGAVELEVTDPNDCRPGDWALRLESDLRGSQFYPLQAVTVVGRDAECDLRIESDLLSRRHAELTIEEDRLKVVDLDSTNGTYLNDERIQSAVARPGDALRFDQHAFVVVGPTPTSFGRQTEAEERTVMRGEEQTRFGEATQFGVPPEEGGQEPPARVPEESPPVQEDAPVQEAPDPAMAAAPPPQPAPDPVQDLLKESLPLAQPEPAPVAEEETCFMAVPGTAARLVDNSGLMQPATLELEQETYVLGRNAQCDVVLSDSSVSKQHARLGGRQGAWSIEDLDSRNGVSVNGERVANATLVDGDRITLGRVELVFESDAPAPAPQDAATALFPGLANAVEQANQADEPPPKSRGGWLGGSLVLLLAVAAAGALYLWRQGMIAF